MNDPVRARAQIIVIISGRGSNLRALIDASRAPRATYQVRQVLSDKPDAPGLETARELGVPALAVPASGLTDREAYDEELQRALQVHAPALIVLAGYMRILSARFVTRFEGRLLNIHPSLLPKYTGLHTHRRVLAAGDSEHGATVHFVTEELDGGPAVLQAKIPVLEDDDAAALAKRVQRVEHRIYPAVVDWFCAGRLTYRDHQAWFDGRRLDAPLQWPAGGH